jgi:hypothetical protein
MKNFDENIYIQIMEEIPFISMNPTSSQIMYEKKTKIKKCWRVRIDTKPMP